MIEFFLAVICSSIIILGYGSFFYFFSFNNKIFSDKEYYELSIFGIVFISFLAVIINFFLPIDKLIGTIFALLGIILFLIFFIKNNYKKKVIKYISLSTFIAFILTFSSNVYRPDAGLYHLPFISILNEEKIIIGLANIHFRFGTNSIIQYLSALYNNYLFNTAYITIPASGIFSNYIIFNYKKIFTNLKKRNYKTSIILFCLLIFSFYSFNNYTKYGNDVPAHIFYFIITILLLEASNNYSNNLFFKISYLSVFLFAIKAFMFLALLFPILIFLIIKKKKNLIINKNFLIIFIFLMSWLIKSLVTSGCFLYPVSQTCIKNLKIYDQEKTILESNSGEAWAKDWVNQSKNNQKLDFTDYNKHFNWIETWSKNHLLVIYEKIIPYIIFLFFLSIFFIIKFYTIKIKTFSHDKSKNLNIYSLLLISFFFTIVWFIKFPLYRYGLGFIIITITLGYSLVINKLISCLSKKNLKYYFISLIFFSFVAFSVKNFYRIIVNKDNLYTNYPWSRIYSLDEKKDNKIQKFIKIKDNDKFLYFYSEGELCMYGNAPCSNYKINGLKKDTIFSYSLYYKN
jgi:hypothetical protein